MTPCDVVVACPILHTESTVMVPPDCCTSCWEHMSFHMLPPMELISLSVSASMHCWMTCGGMLRPSNVIFISHRPGVCGGMSIATADDAERQATATSGR